MHVALMPHDVLSCLLFTERHINPVWARFLNLKDGKAERVTMAYFLYWRRCHGAAANEKKPWNMLRQAVLQRCMPLLFDD